MITEDKVFDAIKASAIGDFDSSIMIPNGTMVIHAKIDVKKFIKELTKPDPVIVVEHASAFQLQVMSMLPADPDYCEYTRNLVRTMNSDHARVKRALRALCGRGLVELVRGLMNDYDGKLYGSGYRLTDAGRKFYREKTSQT